MTPALFLGADGSILHVTPAALRLLEYPSDASIDPYFFTHVHGKNMYRVMQDVAHMVCHRQGQTSWLLRLRTGHGRWRWYRATVYNRLEDDPACIRVELDDV